MEDKIITQYIEKIDRLQMEQDAIYHKFAQKNGLSDTAMWLLYMLNCNNKTYTQQELSQTCFFPKQTVNSSINKLVKENLATLKVIPNSKNKKEVKLTEKGKILASQVTDPLVEAEHNAYGSITTDELQKFIEIFEKINKRLTEETTKI